ncbi:unnamed protein product [Ixodes hexagonus]
MPRIDFLPAYDTPGGYTRRYRGSLIIVKYTWHELWLLFFGVLNILIQVGMGIPLLVASAGITIALPVNGTNTSLSSDLPFQPFAFDVVVLFCVAFGAWFAVSGVLLEHEYEIMLHLACMGLASVYATVEYFVCGFDREDHLVLYRAMLAMALTSLSAILAARSILHPTWTEFVLIGVSEGMIIMYKKFCKFLMLLKLEFVATAIFAILILNTGVHSSTSKFLFVAAIFCYGLILWIVGSLAVRKERPWLAFSYVALSMVAPLFLPVEMSAQFKLVPPPQTRDSPLVHVGAGVFCIIMRVYLHIELLQVYKNFDRGLIDQAFVGLLTPEATGLLTGRRH